MSGYLHEEDEHSSPWGDPTESSNFGAILTGDDGVSPWAVPNEQDSDNDSDPYAVNPVQHSAQAESGFNEQIDSDDENNVSASAVFGAPGAAQGLSFVETTPDPYLTSPRPTTAAPGVSPGRTRRGGRSRKEVLQADPLGGPLGGPLGEPLGGPLGELSPANAKTSGRGLDAKRKELSEVSLAAEHDDGVRQAMSGLSVDASPRGYRTDEDEEHFSADETNDGSRRFVDAATGRYDDDDASSETDVAGKLEVSVGDPIKVGDIASAHTVYTVNITSDMSEYPPTASVTRRYRDFRWLYRALGHNNPGVVVPPPPDKQAVGRFNTDFVEYRRTALAQMIRKISLHPLLRTDDDMIAFLTHENFPEYVKSRVMSDEELEAAGGNSSGGFMSSLGGGIFGKSDEPDVWLTEKRTELDSLELQLRELFKALEVLHTQRKEVADSLAEFANVTEALADVEPTRKLGEVLREFARVHTTLSEQYERQRQQDSVFLESTVDENLRLVNSVRDAYSARQRAQSAALAARNDVEKRRIALEKLQRQGKSQQDRLQATENELTQAEQRAEQLENTAQSTAYRVEAELSRVNREKVRDFRNSVEVFLENAVEAQKQAIELWETFYSRFFSETTA